MLQTQKGKAEQKASNPEELKTRASPNTETEGTDRCSDHQKPMADDDRPANFLLGLSDDAGVDEDVKHRNGQGHQER